MSLWFGRFLDGSGILEVDFFCVNNLPKLRSEKRCNGGRIGSSGGSSSRCSMNCTSSCIEWKGYKNHIKRRNNTYIQQQRQKKTKKRTETIRTECQISSSLQRKEINIYSYLTWYKYLATCAHWKIMIIFLHL